MSMNNPVDVSATIWKTLKLNQTWRIAHISKIRLLGLPTETLYGPSLNFSPEPLDFYFRLVLYPRGFSHDIENPRENPPMDLNLNCVPNNEDPIFFMRATAKVSFLSLDDVPIRVFEKTYQFSRNLGTLKQPVASLSEDELQVLKNSNDELRIHLHVELTPSLRTLPAAHRSFTWSNCANMVDRNVHFFKTGLMADCIVICAGQKFHCHKIILAAQSNWFYKTLTSKLGKKSKTDEIRISEDFQEDGMRKFLQYLYSGELEVTDSLETLIEMLRISDFFGMMCLKEYVAETIVLKLHPGNAITVLEAAEKFASSSLREAVGKEMENNWAHTYKISPEWAEFSKANPKEALDFVMEYIA